MYRGRLTLRKTEISKRCIFQKKTEKYQKYQTKVHINLNTKWSVAYVHNFPYLKLNDK